MKKEWKLQVNEKMNENHKWMKKWISKNHKWMKKWMTIFTSEWKNEWKSKMNEIQKRINFKNEWNSKMNENTKNEWMKPLYNIHTIINPYWSLEVNFWWISFQLTTWICPLCPSRVWFIARLDGAAKPLIFPSLEVSSLRTFKRPSSPPQAMWPWSLFQEIHFSLVLLGIAIWN